MKLLKYVRWWLLYMIGSVMFVILMMVMIRYSRLCGSDDLDNTLYAAKVVFIMFLKMCIFDFVKEL